MSQLISIFMLLLKNKDPDNICRFADSHQASQSTSLLIVLPWVVRGSLGKFWDTKQWTARELSHLLHFFEVLSSAAASAGTNSESSYITHSLRWHSAPIHRQQQLLGSRICVHTSDFSQMRKGRSCSQVRTRLDGSIILQEFSPENELLHWSCGPNGKITWLLNLKLSS